MGSRPKAEEEIVVKPSESAMVMLKATNLSKNIFKTKAAAKANKDDDDEGSDVSAVEDLELAIQNALNLPEDEWGMANRVNMARFLMDTDQVKLNENVRMFDVINEQLTPMNLIRVAEELIARSNAIGEIALRYSPAWSNDFIQSFVYDMGRTVDYGDTDYKQNFVMILRALVSAQERNDFVAISDLFFHEIPAMLRSLIKFHEARMNAARKATRERKKREERRRIHSGLATEEALSMDEVKAYSMRQLAAQGGLGFGNTGGGSF